MLALILLVPATDYVTLVELADEVFFLASLRDLHVGTGVVLEENFFVFCVELNPVLQLWILQESEVRLRFQVDTIMAEQDLLEVGVVEDVWIHSPSSSLTLIVIVGKAESVCTHNGNILIRFQAEHIEFMHHYCVFMLGLWDDGQSVGGLALSLNVFTAHLKEHRWSSTILNGRIASQLKQIRVREHGRDVISVILDFLNQLDGLIELRIISPLQLSVESQDGTRSSIEQIN